MKVLDLKTIVTEMKNQAGLSRFKMAEERIGELVGSSIKITIKTEKS